MATLIRRSNGIYYEISFVHGRRVWCSTGFRRKADALRALKKGWRASLRRSPEVSLSQFETQFLTYAETNFAPTTVLLYKQALRTFGRLIGNRSLKAYTVQEVEAFKTARLKEVSAVKVNIDFRTIKAFFNTALRWKLIEENPFAAAKQVKVPPVRPAYLTKEEFQRLLHVIPQQWFRELVTFAVCTMMRSGEIVNLAWDSVDLKRRLILVENRDGFRLKNAKPRVVPMNEWVFGFLATREKKSGLVFAFPDRRKLSVGYVGRKFKKFAQASGLPDSIHFHSLRHTGASWLVQEGVPIYEVQHLLGHSSILVTQVYSHLTSGELQRAVEKIRVNLN